MARLVRQTRRGAVTGRSSGRNHKVERRDLAQLPLPLDLPGVSHLATAQVEAAMERPQNMVWDFHRAFALPALTRPGAVSDEALAQLRVRLQREETEELAEALEARDLVEVADALADIVYVAYGTAVSFGIDLDAVLAEVHRSNMSKLGPDGSPILREDGKVLKPPTYSRPDIKTVIELQRLDPDQRFG